MRFAILPTMSRQDSDHHAPEEAVIAAREALTASVNNVLKATVYGDLAAIEASGRMLNVRMGVFFVPTTPDDEALEHFVLEQASVDDPKITSRLDGVEVVHEQPVPTSGLYHTRVNLRVTHYSEGIQVFFQDGELLVVNAEGRRIRPLEVYDVSESAFRQSFIQLRPESLEFSAGLSPLKPDRMGQFNPGILPPVARLIAQPGRKALKVL